MHRLSVILVVTATILTVAAVAPAAARQTPPPPPAVAVPPSFDQGQTPPAPPTMGQTPKPLATPTQAPPAPPAAQGQQGQQGQRPLDPAQMVNIRVELAITETIGSNPPVRKTVFLITQSGSRGSVRSTMSRPGGSIGLNVDARPSVQKDGRVSLGLTFQYSPELAPGGASADDNLRPPDLNESMEIFLVDGKPLLISQSADPKGDRKVTVEVTATVVK